MECFDGVCREIFVAPSVTEVLLVLFLIGVTSSGATEVVKIWFRNKCKNHDQKDPWWWQILFRLFPFALGGAMGAGFFTWPWGVATGASGGVLSAVLYRKARELIQNMKDIN